MPFEKGKSGNVNGKPKGSLNILTKTVKERVLDVFNLMQEDPKVNMFTWAKTEPTEFYKIASKLIPSEINAHVENKTIVVKVPDESE